MLFNQYKTVTQNADGRVFAIGDVHGCFEQLCELLDKIQFDESKDQIVFVGDLADRGPDNLKTIGYALDKPYFHLVAGNHEELLVEYMLKTTGFNDASMMQYWAYYDGAWTTTVDEEVLQATAGKLQRQSYYLAEVITQSGLRFGITHAGFNESQWHNPHRDYDPLYYRDLVWSRKMAETPAANCSKVTGIDYTVHGHTIFKAATLKGNAIFIDTGCFLSGRLTALDLNEFAKTQQLEKSITST